MEYCQYGTLNDFCRNYPDRFNDDRVKLDLMTQIARGLRFFHRSKLIHRSIKPSNILLADEDGQVVVKITNFNVFIEEVGTSTKTVVGTKAYLAPEVWPYGDILHRSITEKLDIFALGLTFLAIIQGQCDSQGLMPRVKGLKKSQLSLVIGHLMYMRNEDGEPPLCMTEENPEDNEFLKLVKSIIIRTTYVEPNQRIPADYIFQKLTELAVKQVRLIITIMNYVYSDGQKACIFFSIFFCGSPGVGGVNF